MIRVEVRPECVGYIGSERADEYPEADGWYLDSDGNLQIIAERENDDFLFAEYGAGSFVRVWRDPKNEADQKSQDPFEGKDEQAKENDE